MAILTSFAPIVNDSAHTLILGSMPGELSLQMGQYYAHPRNLFWPIMGELCGFDPSLPYPERIARVQRAGFALWDALLYCEREGNLDTAITAEKPNDFATFLTQYPTIRTIGFNGQKAARLFQRLVWPHLPDSLAKRLKLISLTSTSPANASVSKQAKVAQWTGLF